MARGDTFLYAVDRLAQAVVEHFGGLSSTLTGGRVDGLSRHVHTAAGMEGACIRCGRLAAEGGHGAQAGAAVAVLAIQPVGLGDACAPYQGLVLVLDGKHRVGGKRRILAASLQGGYQQGVAVAPQIADGHAVAGRHRQGVAPLVVACDILHGNLRAVASEGTA